MPIEKRILEQISTTILLLNNKLRLLYINSAGEMLLAVSAQQVIGQPIHAILANLSPHIETKLQQALNQELTFTEREIALTLNDGNTVTVDYSVTCMHHYDAEPKLLIEIYKVDRHLRISREKYLSSQQKAAKAMLKGLAHEIKNPLGGLRGAAQLLERELQQQDLKEYTQIIIAEADRLQNLLNRMLGSYRVPKRQQLNIHQVLERVFSLIHAEYLELKIHKDYDPSIPLIHGNLDQLIQAILNIARNGAQAAGSQGCLVMRTRVLRQFTIGTIRYRLVLLVAIEDNGPGISQEMQESIFLPLVSGTTSGIGLGLTIAQDLISQHGGLIECWSVTGKTVFSVYLPLGMQSD
ncbi:histidine kinase [Achromatium sp. WMS3]|nr:histidine kinase [Achromatium sp. WMS3]